MTVPIRITKGQVFRMVETGALFSFVEIGPGSKLMFRNVDSGRIKAFKFSELEDLLDGRKMVRQGDPDPQSDARKDRVLQLAAARLDARRDEGLKAEAAQAVKQVRNAEILDFYVRHWVKDPKVAISRRAVDKLKRTLREEARRRGYDWDPDYSSLRRARTKMAASGGGLKTFLRTYRKHDPSKRHLPLVMQLRERMIEEYYSSRSMKPGDALAGFFAGFYEEQKRRVEVGLPEQKPPVASTVRRWLKEAESTDNLVEKFGVRAASRATRGHNFAMKAMGALEIVMIDHTQTDVWARVEDEDGNMIGVARPWLVTAVDVFSSMVLGGVLTFEPPSLLSVMLCLKQVVRRKNFLIDRYGYYKGATDGYGLPYIIVVDNGWENVGASFQSACAAARISVEWAPVRTPEYKPQVERLFGAFNTGIWHKLSGGIPYKASDARKAVMPDPRADAVYTLDQLNDLFWEYVVTIRHVESRNDGYKEAPAKAWVQSLTKFHRDVADDVDVLDSFFGIVGTATLTTAGITFEKHRFHDPEAVSGMLGAMLRFEPVRNQRASHLSSGKVKVSFTRNAEDCSYIDVWDYARQQNVRLPNCDPRFSVGLDWKHAERIQRFARQENLAFHSDQEKYIARAAFNEKLKKTAAGASFAEKKKAIRAYHSEVRSVPGTEVRIQYATPSISGMEGVNIPRSLAGESIEGDRIPAKGRKPVRKKMRAKARASGPKTAAPDQYHEKTKRAPHPLDTPVKIEGRGSRTLDISPVVPDADAMMARFAAELDGEHA